MTWQDMPAAVGLYVSRSQFTDWDRKCVKLFRSTILSIWLISFLRWVCVVIRGAWSTCCLLVAAWYINYLLMCGCLSCIINDPILIVLFPVALYILFDFVAFVAFIYFILLYVCLQVMFAVLIIIWALWDTHAVLLSG